jgi:hypothetical protein
VEVNHLRVLVLGLKILESSKLYLIVQVVRAIILILSRFLILSNIGVLANLLNSRFLLRSLKQVLSLQKRAAFAVLLRLCLVTRHIEAFSFSFLHLLLGPLTQFTGRLVRARRFALTVIRLFGFLF